MAWLFFEFRQLVGAEAAIGVVMEVLLGCWLLDYFVVFEPEFHFLLWALLGVRWQVVLALSWHHKVAYERVGAAS